MLSKWNVSSYICYHTHFAGTNAYRKAAWFRSGMSKIYRDGHRFQQTDVKKLDQCLASPALNPVQLGAVQISATYRQRFPQRSCGAVPSCPPDSGQAGDRGAVEAAAGMVARRRRRHRRRRGRLAGVVGVRRCGEARAVAWAGAGAVREAAWAVGAAAQGGWCRRRERDWCAAAWRRRIRIRWRAAWVGQAERGRRSWSRRERRA